MKMINTAENITFAAADEARLICAQAYNIPLAPFFRNRLEQRLVDENIEISALKVDRFHYLYKSFESDGIVSFRIYNWMSTGLPLGMLEGLEMTQQFRCRGFIGRTIEGTPFPFDDMEKDSLADLVWVFPNDGEKYHTKSCAIVSSYPVQMIMNSEIRNKYAPCDKCGSKVAENGTQVYCFQAYGESYHLFACPSVDKYVISIEKNQAEARGYKPCLKCGGVE